jgi:heterogeneous nuclear ribonucleoprotein U-like protein 1
LAKKKNLGSHQWKDTWASKIPLENRLRGASRPATRADCQMIMMCGLPCAGKTTWANKFSAQNPDLKFTILGTNALLDKMKVNGYYTGRYVKNSLIL